MVPPLLARLEDLETAFRSLASDPRRLGSTIIAFLPSMSDSRVAKG
jgi:hypothetical protein